MRERSGLDIALIVLDLFVAVSAVPCGAMLALRPDGALLRIPLWLLAGSPFHDYLIPGVILAVVVGGSAMLGAVMQLRGMPRAALFSAASGAILCGWILGELLLLSFRHFLQAIYGGTGLLMLLLALLRNRTGGSGRSGAAIG